MSSRIAFPAALLVIIGLAIGAGIAFAVQQGGTATGQDDPCYGLGKLVATHQYTVTEEFAQIAARDLGLDLTPGEVREARDCQISEFEIGTIDGATGKGLSLYTDWAAIVATGTAYAEADETPPNPIRDARATAVQESFVTPEVSADLTAGCDPDWTRTTLEGVQAVVCHPSTWVVKADDIPEGMVGTETVEVGVLGRGTESHNTKCDSPTVVNVPGGTARVCALGPTAFARVNYGLALPNGLNVGINVFKDATPEDEAIALRVAANAEWLR
jgi:hypothetical protein